MLYSVYIFVYCVKGFVRCIFQIKFILFAFKDEHGGVRRTLLLLSGGEGGLGLVSVGTVLR